MTQTSSGGFRARSMSISEKKNIAIQWSQSRLKMRAFCEEHGVTVSMLKNWRKQFGTPAKVSRRRKFIQVKTAGLPAAVFQQPFAEVVAPCGTRVIFHQAVDASILQALLTTR